VEQSCIQNKALITPSSLMAKYGCAPTNEKVHDEKVHNEKVKFSKST